MKPMVITLGAGSSNNTEVLTFEEAFGEHSNAKGRHKAKKTQRKQQRKTKRLARIENKGERKLARQDVRTQTALAKQGRRTAKKQERLYRRSLGQTEADMGDQTNLETGDVGGAALGIGTDPNYVPQDYGNEGGGEEQYPPQEEQYFEEGNGSGYEEEGGSDNTDYVDESGYDESGYDEGGDGGDVDGGEETDFIEGAKVTPEVQKHADKIEWNKELIDRLVEKANYHQAEGETFNADVTREEIEGRKARVIELYAELEGYANCEGEFISHSDGDYSYVRGAKKSKIQQTQSSGTVGMDKGKKKQSKQYRKAEAKAALRESKNKRSLAKQARVAKKQGHGGDVAVVDNELNPEIQENRIDIPAQEESSVTGLTGLDQTNDFDAAEMTEYEVKSNASGKSKINWTGVIIGVVIAGAAIVLINKYVIKKS